MTVSPMRLDRDRFANCQALADRGATPGERAPVRAAGARVAASAGMTLDVAARFVGAAFSLPLHTALCQYSPASGPPYPYRLWRKPLSNPSRSLSPSVAEMMAQKAAAIASGSDTTPCLSSAPVREGACRAGEEVPVASHGGLTSPAPSTSPASAKGRTRFHSSKPPESWIARERSAALPDPSTTTAPLYAIATTARSVGVAPNGTV